MLTLFEDLLGVRLDVVMGISFTIMYLIYYLVEVVKRPVVLGGAALCGVVRAEVPAARSRFWAAPWCAEARLQTAAAALVRGKLLPPGRWVRRLVRLPDGGTVALEWAGGAPGGRARRVLLLLPGLAGGAGADYARLAAAAAARLRAHLAVMSYRGLHGLPLTSGKMYSALSHDDVSAVVELLREEYPRARLMACGVSLGGLLLGGHLAAADTALSCALLLAAPLDVPRGAANVEIGALNAAMSRHMAARLVAAAARHSARLAADWARVLAARSVRQFDAALTAPALGLASPDHYYAAASLRPRLHAVRVPTLAVCAADDPFQPLHVLPVREAASSANIALMICSRGGHVGLVDAAGRFLPRLLADYFGAMLRRPAPPPPPRAAAPAPRARYLSRAEVLADAELLAAAPRDYDDYAADYDPYDDAAS